MMDSSSVNSNSLIQSSNQTSRGTKIVKPGSDMDKNAFLKILTAELSNQDPDNTKDSSQYVAQMAQFTSLEQMTNLNTTMTMNAANSLIGKQITLKTLDPNGEPYKGVVQGVTNDSGTVKLNVQVDENGTTDVKDFGYDEITAISGNSDSASSNVNSNMNILQAASLIGKKAEFNVADSSGYNYTGTIKAAYKNGSSISFSVLLDGKNSVKDFSIDKLSSVFSL
jgi:flagellar basal-body rod modification protein FlgD